MARAINQIDWARVIVLACKGTAAAARPKMSIVTPVAAQLPEVFTRLDISTARRQAHFISQSIIECDYYKTLEEYASGDAYDTRTDMGFTAARDGDGRTNKGFGIFQSTGPNNQRRALAGLLKLGFRVSQDVHNAKAVLTDPRYAAWAAGIWWRDNKMNAIADRDKDGTLCSRQVNRGNANSKKAANHEADRKRAFAATWRVLQNPPLIANAPVAMVGIMRTMDGLPKPGEQLGVTDPPAAPARYVGGGGPVPDRAFMPGGGEDLELPEIQGADVLEMGRALNRVLPGGEPAEPGDSLDPAPSPGSPPVPLPAEPVAPGLPDGLTKAAQGRLRELGYYVVGNADGDAGGRTVGALAMFQHTAGLPVTGQLDQETLTGLYLDSAPHAPVTMERALATASDLRGESQIVDATAKVQTASLWQVLTGGVMAACTAVVSGFSDTMSALAGVRQSFEDVPGWVWAGGAVLVLMVPALYAYAQAHKAQRARVADYNTGKTA